MFRSCRPSGRGVRKKLKRKPITRVSYSLQAPRGRLRRGGVRKTTEVGGRKRGVHKERLFERAGPSKKKVHLFASGSAWEK